jgi:hypothetical protein
MNGSTEAACFLFGSLYMIPKATHQNLEGSLFQWRNLFDGVSRRRLYLCSIPRADSPCMTKETSSVWRQEDSNQELIPWEELYRPRAMVAGPHGKSIGGYPDYGLIGGAIGVYDPKTNGKRIFRNVVENQALPPRLP